MDIEYPLEFSCSGPAEQGELVKFAGMHRHGPCDIYLVTDALSDRRQIDTSAGDITRTYPVDSVSFVIKEEGEEQIGLEMTRTGTHVHSQNPRARYADYLPQVDRCRELATVLFENGLTITWYQTAKKQHKTRHDRNRRRLRHRHDRRRSFRRQT